MGVHTRDMQTIDICPVYTHYHEISVTRFNLLSGFRSHIIQNGGQKIEILEVFLKVLFSHFRMLSRFCFENITEAKDMNYVCVI